MTHKIMRLCGAAVLRFLAFVALVVVAVVAASAAARAQSPGDVQTEIIQQDSVRGEVVLRLSNGSGQNGAFRRFDYYRVRHFTVGLGANNFVGDHIVSVSIASVSVSLVAPTVSLTISNLAPGVRHLFYGQACSLPGCSRQTGSGHRVFDMPPRFLPPPQNFSATSGDGYVLLSWLPPPTLSYVGEVFGYAIYKGDARLNLPSPQATSHIFRDVTNYQKIVYRAQAINASGGGLMASITIYAGSLAPGAPYADTEDNFLRDSEGRFVTRSGVFRARARAAPLGFTTPVPTDSWEFEFSANGQAWTITTNLTAAVATLTVLSDLQGGVLHTIRAVAVNRFGKTKGGPSYFTPPLYLNSLLPPPQNVVANWSGNNMVEAVVSSPTAQTTLQHGYWAGAYLGSSLVAEATSGVSVSTLTLRNLPNGVAYRVEAASYANGQIGGARATAVANMPPAVANFVGHRQRRGVINLSWSPASPVNLNNYVVIGPDGNRIVPAAATSYVYRFNESPPQGAYVFSLFHSNPVGNGAAVYATVLVLPPQNVVANGRAGNLVEVTFDSPVGLSNLPHGYWAGAYLGSSLVATAISDVSVSALTLRNLPNGVAYRVEVAVRLLNGRIGDARATDHADMPPARPQNFIGRYAAHDARIISLSWRRPASSTNLNNYLIVEAGGNYFVDSNATSFDLIYRESDSREKHVISLFAGNAAGAASLVVATVLALPAPQNIVANWSEANMITVAIEPPARSTPLQHGYWAGAYLGSSLVATATSGVSVSALTLRNLPNGVAYRVEVASYSHLYGQRGVARAVAVVDAPPARPADFLGFYNTNDNAVYFNWRPAASPVSLDNYVLSLNGGGSSVVVSAAATSYYYRFSERPVTVANFFSLFPHNRVGVGKVAVATVVIPPVIPPEGLPAAPQNFAAEPRHFQIAFSWSLPPPASGVAEVAGFRLLSDDDRVWEIPGAGVTSYLISSHGHVTGVYSLQAVNSVGAGAPAFVTAFAGSKPGVPYADATPDKRLYDSNGVAVASAGVFRALHRSQPLGVAAPVPVESWEFEFSAAGQTWTITANLTANVATLTVSSGLQAGVLHTARAIAVNRFGKTKGAASNFYPPYPDSLLLPPLDITVGGIVGNRITVGFSHPLPGQRTVPSGYWVGAYDGNRLVAAATAAGDASGLTLQNTPNIVNTYQIRAAGHIHGQIGSTRLSIDAYTPPVAAVGLSAQFSGDRNVDLRWQHPAGNLWRIRYEISGNGSPPQVISRAATFYSWDLGAPANVGQEYVFTLRAFNDRGGGSFAVATVVYLPPAYSFTGGFSPADKLFTLGWRSPAGVSVLSYQLSYNNRSSNVVISLSADEREARVAAPFGYAYNFTLETSARNGSTPFSQTLALSLNMPPSKPQIASNWQYLADSFSPNSRFRGWFVHTIASPVSILGYTVLANGAPLPTIAQYSSNYSHDDSQGRPVHVVAIDGDINLGVIEFFAINAAGRGDAFTLRVGNITSPGTPPAPPGLTVTFDHTQGRVSIRYNFPGSWSSYAVQRFVLRVADPTLGLVSYPNFGDPEAGFYGWRNGHIENAWGKSSYRLRAVNSSGQGPDSYFTVNAPPPPPAFRVSVVGTTRIGIDLHPLQSTLRTKSDPPILRYQLAYGNLSLTLVAETEAYTLTGLAPATPYTLALRAFNQYGGGPGMTIAATTRSLPAGVLLPSLASLRATVVGSGSVSVSWSLPANAVALGYSLRFNGQTISLAANVSSTLFLGLTNGARHAFTMRAIGQGGPGPALTVSVAMPPAAPAFVGAYYTTLGLRLTVGQTQSDSELAGYRIDFRGLSDSVGIHLESNALFDHLFANGETYHLTVRALAVGVEGFPRVGAVVTPPAAIASVSVASGPGVVTMSWRPPASGSPILYYRWLHRGVAHTVGGNITAFVARGLQNAERLRFTLFAVNNPAGEVVMDNGITVLATTPPTEPFIYVYPGDEKADLLWQPPERAIGGGVSAYIVYVNGAPTLTISAVGGAVVQNTTLLGLQNYAQIEVGVAAKNPIGLGARAVTLVTPTDVTRAPAAPVILSVSSPPLDERVELTWDEPSGDARSRVFTYILRANGAATLTLPASARGATLLGLINGKPQSLQLLAKNVIGTSPAATTVGIAQGPPRVPQNVRTESDIRRIRIRGEPSPDMGDSAPTHYRVDNHDVTRNRGRFGDSSHINYRLTLSQHGVVLFDIVNLRAGLHKFTVYGVNKYGEGDRLVLSEFVTAGIPPPRNLRAKTADTAITLIWERPQIEEGIIAYYMNWGTGFERYDYVSDPYLPGTFMGVITTNITNGMERRIVMQSIPLDHRELLGDAHFITIYATPGFPPGAIPFFTGYSNSNGRIPILWGEAANNQGSPITGYELTYNGVAQTLSASARSALLEGLVNGKTYSLTLRAESTSGKGPPIVAFATPRARPTPPTSLVAAGAFGAITLTWGPPQNDGGLSITAYLINYKTGANDLTATVAGLAFTLSNLLAGQTATFAARAKSAAGASDAATAVAIAYDAPSAPLDLRARRENNAAVLTWRPPTRSNGSPLRGYWLEYGDTRQSLGVAASAHIATALTNGRVYLFSLYAHNDYGNGATATASAKPATTPATPAGLRAAFADGAITLNWNLATAIAETGGEPVTGYAVYYGANQITLLGAVASVVVSGLVNGEIVAFSVYAVNALGESAIPATISESPGALPSAPTGLRAAEGDGVISLLWGPPASAGGSPLLGYRLVYGGQTINLGANASGHLLSGLANGQTITFALRARNRAGLGAVANISAAARGKPSAPTGIAALGGAGSIALTWGPPQNDNGAAVTGYVISYKGTATTTTEESFLLLNLSSGERVNFTVQAANSVGVGAGARAQGVEGVSLPSAPTNLRAQRGNGAVTLFWGAPTRLYGSTPEGYEIAYNGQTQSVGANVTTHTATGLINGVTYQFSVYAKSNRGNGAAAFVGAKPATTPAAPANLRALFADGAITLQWSLATVAGQTGGEPITAHIVRYGANRAATVGAVTSAVIGNLTNGETIAFSIYAVNAAGRGATPAVISEYASAPPGAPTGLLAQDGDGAVTLQWGAPANTGGAAITGYVVRHAGGEITTSFGGATLTGLANGAPIAVSVFAVNRSGRGAAAAATATAATTPGAPAGLRATPGQDAVTLQWSAPANNGGASITAYTAEWNGQSTLVLGSLLVARGITNGETARFTVRARNRKGAGAPASVVVGVFAPPGAPTSVAAAGAYGVVTLSWGAPANNGGASITAYLINYKGSLAAVAGFARSFVLSNLFAGGTVNFTVQAANSVGVGPGATAQGVAYDALSAPTSLRAQGGSGVVTLSWGAPARLYGSTLEGYGLEYGGLTRSFDANVTSHTVSGLINGIEYEFRLYAKSDYGNGATATARVTPATTPLAPSNLSAAFADRAITLRWNLPTGLGTGGLPITAHIIDYAEHKETTFLGNVVRYFINRSATVGSVNFAVIGNLDNGDTVSFSVYAVNAAGRGAAPATISEYPNAAPGAPTSLLAQDGNGVITVQWGAPANNGGATIAGYDVEYTGGLLTTSAAARGVTLTGLANGAPISIGVFAVNRSGRGAVAAATATAATTPGAPAGLRAQDNDGVVTLLWNAPANNGGAAVVEYVVAVGGVSITTSAAVVAITGLANGAPITASVFAINRVGRGPYSAPITATAATTASAPLSLQAAPGDGVVTLAWQTPAANGGASITAYLARWNAQSVLAFGNSVVASGLVNGQTITFAVGARSRKGLGAEASVVATPRGKPSAPTSVFADGAYGVVTLSWGAPANNGGVSITAYWINYKGSLATVAGLTRSFVVSNLFAGETVVFTARAVNSFGAGAGATAAGVARDAPTAPTSLRATRDDGAVVLNWGAPARLNGATVRGYQISLYSQAAFDPQPQSVGASANAHTVTGLVNDAAYTFYVYANSDYGVGATATASATPGARPPAPANLRAAFANGAISLQWSLVTAVLTNPVTGYLVRYKANAETLGVVASVVVGGLTNGETINFSVYAVNAVGESAVPATIAEYPSAPPGAPSGLRSQDGDGVVTLLWGAPVNNGGAAVTAYFVEHAGGSLTTSAAPVALTGLANNEPITATIFAINRAGRGANFAAITATAAASPAAPTSLRALEGNGVITLLWNPPAQTGGPPLLGYRLFYNGQSVNIGAGASGHLLQGLTNGQTITFALRARNRIGLGAAASVVAAGRSAPSAPQGVGAFGLVGNITVTWSAPANDNGAAVTAYVVAYKATTTTTPGLGFTLFGLSPGEAVSFTIRAQNSVGLSPAAFAAASLPNFPGVPVGLSATVFAAGAGGFASWNMAWRAPASDGGATITGYVLTYSGVTLRVAAPAGFSSGLLERGVSHVFALRAANAVGLGGATLTTLSAAVAPPAAPPGFVASAFVNGTGASLRWQSQPMAAAATITGYILSYGGVSQNIAATATAATIGGLLAGEQYAFTLRAGNNTGLGSASFATASLPNLPGAPIGFVATVLSGDALLSWSAPASNGGTPLTGYVLSYGNVSQNIAATATAATIVGLFGGRQYAFTLRAGNGVGLGAGVFAAAALPVAAPLAPLGLRASALSLAARLVWQAPAHNGGASITNYVLSYGATTANMGVVTMTTIGGLTAGELYLFTVRAQNTAGLGAGATAQVVPWDLPSAPTSLSAQRGNGVVTLTWGAPAQLNGVALRGYEIVYSGQTQSVGANAAGYTATGLANGAEYEFRVYAKSDYGDGATATASAKPATTPATPANLRAFFADGAITLQWSLVTGASAGGETVTAYIVRYGANRAATVGAATSAVIGNLTNGETIAFSVYAINAVGESALPATINEYANTTAGAPAGLQAQDGNGVITLQWNAPASNGGAAITAYIVEYTGGSLTAAGARATLTGLSNGAPITATVFAVNRGGRGAASSPIVATAATTASAPTSLRAAEGDGVVTLTWGAPSAAGGASVTAYMVEWNGQSTLVSNLSLVVSGLTNGETASFTLRARNRKGAGAAANVSAAGRGKPSAPTAVNAVGSSGNITVTWNAPANDNGASVTAYIVSYKGTMTTTPGQSFTLSGLSAGETVNFTVQAVNSVGIGIGATTQGVARDAPTAPTNLRAQRGNGVVTLAWGAPTQLNGAALQGYEIVYNGQTQSVGASATGYTATGLANGTDYEFRVYAKSDYGNGAAAITTARPATTPNAPANLRAFFANRAITLQWSLATGADTGGEPVTAYIVRYGANREAPVGAASSIIIGGLTNGETIAFSIYAVNAVGESALPATITEYASATPSAPAGLQAQDGNGVITLQWSAPSANGGAAITAYIVEYTGGALTAATTRATLTGLSNGAPITATVFAVNRGGRGAASSPVVATAATTPGAPAGLQAQDDSGVITLQWSAPNNGGAAITAYVVEYAGGAITAAANRATITGLTNGAPITATVFAVNRVGRGAASSPIVATAATTASAPTNLQAAEGDGVVTLTWGAPSAAGGAAVTAYMVEWNGQSTLVSGLSLVVSGLTNGETASFTLRARNRKGAGAAASVSAASRGKPGAPTAVNAVGSSDSITLTWNPPANDNGAAVTAYIVSYKGIMTTTPGQSFTLSGLSAGETVNFTVQAVNIFGAGAGATTQGVARDAPTAPTNLRAQPGNGVVTLTWGAPAHLNGATLQGYEIAYDGQTQSVGANATSYTATGLANGAEYEFRVYAKSDYGNGAAATTTARPATAPSAPTNLRAQRGNGVVTLTWGAPAQFNGATLQGYEIVYNGQTQSVGANAAGHTATGLANGTEYEFRVYAKSDYGNGAAAITAAKPATTPNAPASLRAFFADGAITLQWSLATGADTGGEPVTAHIVRYGANKSATVGAATSAVIGNLTNGETIAFSVYAVNTVGESATPATVGEYANTTPGAPTGLQAEDGNGVITLQWSAPANNGGAAIAGYIVEYTGGALTAARARATLTGLSNGAPITATVFAVNRGGRGAASSPVVATAATTPGAPTSLRATEENGVVTLTWGAPGATGGAAVTAYMVEWNGQSTLVSNLSLVVSGLTNVETVSFTIRARNRKGLGAAASVFATRRGKPDAPTAVNAVGSIDSITLTWNPPANDNGAAVTAYIVSYKGAMATTSGQSFTLSGLSAGETVNFTVQAVNIFGAGAGATAQGVANNAPTAPTNLRAQRGNGVVTLTWGAPAHLKGATLQGYEIVYNGQTQSVGASATSYTATGLTNGAEYEFRVYAKSDYGDGAAAVIIAKPATTPSAVTDFFARGDDGVISLSWDAPNNGGAEITGYVLYVNGAETLAVAGIARSAALVGLTNGREYTLGILAKNFVGAGPISQITATPANRPGAPQGFSVAAGNGKISLYWRAPASDGGAPITAYIAFVDGRQAAAFGAAAQTATLENLANGKTYALGLAAANKSGTGAQATASAIPYTVPDAPKDVYFKKHGNGRLTVSWRPANGNGRPVLDYEVSLAGPGIMLAATVDANNLLMAGFTVGASAVYSVYVRARNLAGYGPLVLAIDEGDFRREKEADAVMLPKLAGAFSRRWGKALGGRLGVGGGGAGGAKLRALGASFSPNDATRGVAELLRKHGGAIANGEKIDESALRNAEFALPLGGGGGGGKGAGGADGAGLWGGDGLRGGAGLWGGASYTNLKGDDGEAVWDGEHFSYHAGVDLGLSYNKLVGVMLTRDETDAKYRAKSGGDYNKYNLRAVGAHPYFLWSPSNGRRRFWAAVGYAKGEAETVIGESTKTRDLNTYSAFGGFHSILLKDRIGGVLDLQADAAAARVEVENGGVATAHNLRMLLEIRSEFRGLNGNVFLPFLQAGGRLQKDGKGVAAGWEAYTGLRWTNAVKNWRAELSGGASHLYGSDNKQKEWGFEGVLSKRVDPLGKGLSLDLSAQYGGKTKDMSLRGDFWRPLVAEDNAGGGGGFGFGADLGYGITRAGALWRPYFGATFGAGGERRAGLAWRQLLRANMEARAGVEATRLHDKTQLNVNMGVNY